MSLRSWAWQLASMMMRSTLQPLLTTTETMSPIKTLHRPHLGEMLHPQMVLEEVSNRLGYYSAFKLQPIANRQRGRSVDFIGTWGIRRMQSYADCLP